MALDASAVKFLCAAKAIGVDFTTTAMIGRQSFWSLKPDDLGDVFDVLAVDQDPAEFLKAHEYAEPFFKLLGADTVDSVDYSDYERATHVHDMNTPLPDHLKGRFSAVHDGGTIEHVFNIPQAFKNCMEMVRVGGHFLQANIANNWMGHGFWQFSPELLFRLFSPANGYKIEFVVLHEVAKNAPWYLARDPEQIRRRVQLVNSTPTYILTAAKRVADVPILATPPQQSDYQPMWSDTKPGAVRAKTSASVGRTLLKSIPAPLKRLARTVRPKPAFDPACYQRVGEQDFLRGRLPR